MTDLALKLRILWNTPFSRSRDKSWEAVATYVQKLIHEAKAAERSKIKKRLAKVEQRDNGKSY